MKSEGYMRQNLATESCKHGYKCMTVLCKRTVLCKYIYKKNGIKFAVRYSFDSAKDARIDKTWFDGSSKKRKS